MRQTGIHRAIAVCILASSIALLPAAAGTEDPGSPALAMVQDPSPERSGGRGNEPGAHPAAPPTLLRSKFTGGIDPATESSQALVREVEPNNSAGAATPLGGTNVVGLGNIYPAGESDYWSFQASAGDRVFAATMTSMSASLVFDTILDLVRPDGTTVLESDDNDGSFGSSASSIAGKLLDASGTWYLRVREGSNAYPITPYMLHVRIQSGAATPEAEANDTPATANAAPASGYISGTHGTATDSDYFSVSLNAGDTVYLGLDPDPERNGITWNPRLGLGLFGDAGNQVPVVDDTNTTSPNSEAFFTTVKNAGTYYILVGSATATGGASQTYLLSVSVHPATPATPVCNTYSSSDVPLTIPAGGGLVSSRLFVPGHPRIADLDVSVRLSHAVMSDIDANLRSPAGNNNGLFTDVGETAPGGQSQMDLTLDDEAGVPITSFRIMKGLVVTPSYKYRLSWFDGEDAGGTWYLDLRDDTADANGGTLLGWSVTICEPPPPPACAGTMVTLYSSDFEDGDGGFAHTGFGGPDDWGRGLPSGDSDPILSCNSGTNCWKTNLTGWYSNSVDEQLYSPLISLAGVQAPIRASWAMKYQMENASYDTFLVGIIDSFNNAEIVHQFFDATMDMSVGVGGADYVNESAGWGLFSADASAYAGTGISLAWELASDSTLGSEWSGLAVDDVVVTGCCTAASCDDFDLCTNDVCDAQAGCIHPPRCDDGNACTVDICNSLNGACANTPLTGPACDDGNACTIGDACAAGACIGAPLTGPTCDDGNPCTQNDVCGAGVCAGTPAPPAELGDSLRVTKSGSLATVSWTDPPGPYAVYRGSRPGSGAWAYNHACFASPVPGSSAGDGALPGLGAAYYYLVTRKTACGESVPGRNSSGGAIPNASPCP